MRCLLWLGWMCCLSASLCMAADDSLTVLPEDPANPPRQRLHRWLLEQAQEHFDARRAEVAAIKTPEQILARKEKLRAAFLKSLGGFPEKTPLNAQVAGKLQRDGYTVEKVIFESRPQHHVTANLYLPAGAGPFPGVLVPCGHSANGKAAEAYQKACLLLVKHGFAVLIYDPIGQGERIQLLNDQGQPAIKGSTSEHTMIGVGALLVGRQCATYRIWDGIRAMDYLASRPEVDPERLGCTGNSGGGTLTAYLMALDDRIACAAPSCYITSLERLFATIGPQDAEQNITGQVAFGMEHADYILLRAPKPTLICTGTQDFFDITGAWTTYREAKRMYGALGFGERVDLFEFNDPHGFSMPRRVAALRWMRRWLQHSDDAPVEPELPIEQDADLQCTRTGQVLSDLQGVSAFDLNRLRADELAKQRNGGDLSEGELKTAVVTALRLPASIPAAKLPPLEMMTAISRDGYTIYKGEIETEPGIKLPVLRFQPDQVQADWLPVIYLHGLGKAADAGPGGIIEDFVRPKDSAGQVVWAIDLRGWGELAPAVSKGNWAEPFGVDTKEAFLSLHIDRPLIGQRVLDVLSIVQAVADDEGVEMMGAEGAGDIVLQAVLLDPKIRLFSLKKGSLKSWTEVASEPISHNQLTNVVPGVLEHYDSPDIFAKVQARLVNRLK